MKLTIYSDGGARGNPGPAGFGVVIDDEQGKKIDEHAEYIGETTNNQAEYRGAIWGLKRAAELGATAVELKADSLLLVKQANGEYKVKHPEIAQRFLQLKNAEASINGRVKYTHIPREKNKRADALANAAMDRGKR